MTIKIVIGTYEGFLYGWECEEIKNEEGKLVMNMKLEYGYAAHIGCVKSVAMMHSDKFDTLVSGGEDEAIKLYNLKKRVEIGSLVHHEGSVSCLEFFGQSHLISASYDKTLCIWRVADWNCVHILAGHKGEIYDFSVHPSGKIALSVAKDRTMRMWNLVKGRSAYIRRLTRDANSILWSTDGNCYSLLFNNHVDVYSTATGELLCNLQHKDRINTMAFLSKDILVVGGEEKVLYIWKIDGSLLGKVKSSAKTRIRSAIVVEQNLELEKSSSSSSLPYLVTVSTDGCVEIWDLSPVLSTNKEIDFLDIKALAKAEGRNGMRVTCLTAAIVEKQLEPTVTVVEPFEQEEQKKPIQEKIIKKARVVVELENNN